MSPLSPHLPGKAHRVRVVSSEERLAVRGRRRVERRGLVSPATLVDSQFQL